MNRVETGYRLPGGAIKGVFAAMLAPLVFLALASCGQDVSNGGNGGAEAVRETPAGIVLYGDTRTGHDAHREVVSAIMIDDPDVVFHAGDLVANGLSPEEWETFNSISGPLMNSVEYYPVIGNHDVGELYFENFDLPGNEMWYCIKYNDIHFLLLDSNSDLSEGSEQRAWLVSQLESDDGGAFRVAVFHHPPFSSSLPLEDETGFGAEVLPIFKRYGIDLVLNGHSHTYERSLYEGVYYVTSGGGGAPLDQQIRFTPYSQVFASEYHYLMVRLEGELLRVEAWGIDSGLIDSFTVDRYAPEG